MLPHNNMIPENCNAWVCPYKLFGHYVYVIAYCIYQYFCVNSWCASPIRSQHRHNNRGSLYLVEGHSYWVDLSQSLRTSQNSESTGSVLTKWSNNYSHLDFSCGCLFFQVKVKNILLPYKQSKTLLIQNTSIVDIWQWGVWEALLIGPSYTWNHCKQSKIYGDGAMNR